MKEYNVELVNQRTAHNKKPNTDGFTAAWLGR